MLIHFTKLFTCSVLMNCMQGIAITKKNGELRHYQAERINISFFCI